MQTELQGLGFRDPKTLNQTQNPKATPESREVFVEEGDNFADLTCPRGRTIGLGSLVFWGLGVWGVGFRGLGCKGCRGLKSRFYSVQGVFFGFWGFRVQVLWDRSLSGSKFKLVSTYNIRSNLSV